MQWLQRRRAAIMRWAHVLAPAALLFLAVSFKVRQVDWVEWVQLKAFDAFQVARPRPYEPVPVRIIDIDDESLARLGQWPWPRTLVARLVARLRDLGASSIAFDVVFAEPDRTSPSRVAALWPDAGDLRGRLAAMPDHDRVLARAFASANVVTGFVLTGEKNGVVPKARAPFAFGGDGPLAYLDDWSGAVVNLPLLEEAAAGNGNFGFRAEHDGVIRRVPLVFRRGQTLLPSLSAEALRTAQGAVNYSIKSSGGSGETGFGEHTGISKIKIGSYIVPTDGSGRVWVYYTGLDPEVRRQRTIPVWEVFEKGFDARRLEGAICYVGTSAAGLKDLRATPLDPAAPGVEVHANVTEQILLQQFLQRPDWALGAELLYMVALGLTLLFLLPRLGAALCAPVALAGIAAAVGASWHAFANMRYLIDPVFPALGALLIYMSSSLISYLKSEAERRQVKGAFSRYMSPALVEQLAQHPEKLRLGGEMREMTFHFCDIRGFTTISEQFDPHGLTKFINRFLTPMTELLLQHQGVIDKYMGDCIMAFWNAPLDDPDHVHHACAAALAMHKRLRELNAQWEAEAKAAGKKFIPIRIGTGLNTGTCIVGNMGSDQRFDYSVLGDDVNLASRLEGQSKTYGVDIVLGPRTREKAPEFAALELDLIRVKGKTVPVRIYTLQGDAALRDGAEFSDLRARHERMLAAYRSQRWAEAKALILECRKAPFPLKTLYDLYDARIAAYEAAPPPPDWDGTFTATSK